MYISAAKRTFRLGNTSAMGEEIKTGTDFLVFGVPVSKIELDIDPDDKVRGFARPSDTQPIS